MPNHPRRTVPPTTLTIIAVLLVLPMIGLLLVSSYARNSPKLWGFPFFYWYQLLWMFLETAMTYTALVLVRRARAQR